MKEPRDPRLVGGLVLLALVVLGIGYALISGKNPKTCQLTATSLGLIAVGLQKDHSAGEIVAVAGGGFLASKACESFVEHAISNPQDRQKAEVQGLNGASSTQSISGAELSAPPPPTPQTQYEGTKAIVQRASVCESYTDSTQFGECLKGNIDPP